MPALLIALASSKNPDVLSAGLIAMGKSAVDHPEIEVVQVLRQHLPDGNIDVREAAVLALGLSGHPDAASDLAALLNNTRAGRRLVDRSKVGDRVRTFAGYALGLLAQRSDSPDVALKALDALVEALADKSIDDRGVLTGVLNGIRLLGATPGPGGKYKRIRWTAIAALEKHLRRRMSSKLAVVQSHGLTAIAHLARRGSDAERERAIRLAVDVLQRRRDTEGATYVSATIALGELLSPRHADELGVLIKHIKKPRDSLVPKFAMIALGQIGGATALEQLGDAFRKGKRDVKPWAAIGLGLLAFEPEAGAKPITTGTRSVQPRWKSQVSDLLSAGLKSENSKDLRTAIAIGLGLAGVKSAAPRIREIASESKSEDHKGLLCVALAMLDDRAAVGIARGGMNTVRSPVFFGQAALALAEYDERAASADAVARLSNTRLGPGYVTWLAASAQAIGHFKNAKDLPALVDLLLVEKGKRRQPFNAGLDHYRAAFAAAAMGSITDRDPLGFGAHIAHGMNYTAREQTISNGKNGILDIF